MKFKFLTPFLLMVGLFGTINAQTIGIMTSPPGTTTHSMGVAIAKVIVEKAGLRALVQPQATSPFLAVDSGTAEFGMSPSFELTFAVNGIEEYKDIGPRKNLRLAATLMPYRVALHVRKNSDIKSIKDLKGKRVPSGFHALKAIPRMITALLANGGLSYDDVKQVPVPNVARSAEDFGAGKIDVLYFALGAGAVMEVSKKVGGIRILPLVPSPEAVERMEKILPGAYLKDVVPAPNIEGLTEPTKVLHFNNVLYTNKNISEEIIYQVVKAIYENKKDLVSSYKEFSIFSPEQMATPVKNVEFHKGAMKFYKEIGLCPPKQWE